MFNEIAVETHRLRKSYGSGPVLDGIDLRVDRGSVFALLGPNGAGKTTTVRILATLVTPDGGWAQVSGHDVLAQRRAVRQMISLTGQYAALDAPLTGRENLEMVGRLLRLPAGAARTRAKELLVQFDLTDAGDRRVETYSGGMRRRLDLAASLICQPEVVFLDEPTTGLDPRSRQAMWETVTGLTASGVTVFLTTQYLEEADYLADRIALLDGGRIVAEGTSEELKQQVAGQRLDLQLSDPPTFALIRDYLGERALHTDRSRLTVGIATDGAATDIRGLLDELDPERVHVTRFSLHQASLDDVFMTLTGHHTDTTERETTYV
jgi:ABC-2 type transport system ATP-binding protein